MPATFTIYNYGRPDIAGGFKSIPLENAVFRSLYPIPGAPQISSLKPGERTTARDRVGDLYSVVRDES
jgi:hypothetical protein